VPKVEKIRGLNLPGTPKTTSTCRGRPLLFTLLVVVVRIKIEFAYKTVGDKTRGNKVLGESDIDLRVSDFTEILVGSRKIDWIEQA
jgi:hypothetical protein